MNSRITSQNPMIRTILTVSLIKTGRFTRAATNKSKRTIMLKAKPVKNKRIMMNLLAEATKLPNQIPSYGKLFANALLYFFLTSPSNPV